MLINKMEAPLDMQVGTKFETKKYGNVVVIEYYNTYTVIIAFENTGNIRSTTATKLRSGQIVDRSVLPQSIMIGKKIYSENHGVLTIINVESENIVMLESENGSEVRMLLPIVKKLLNNSEEHVLQPPLVASTSLKQLAKRNKRTKDVNKLIKKMLNDYGD